MQYIFSFTKSIIIPNTLTSFLSVSVSVFLSLAHSFSLSLLLSRSLSHFPTNFLILLLAQFPKQSAVLLCLKLNPSYERKLKVDQRYLDKDLCLTFCCFTSFTSNSCTRQDRQDLTRERSTSIILQWLQECNMLCVHETGSWGQTMKATKKLSTGVSMY